MVVVTGRDYRVAKCVSFFVGLALMINFFKKKEFLCAVIHRKVVSLQLQTTAVAIRNKSMSEKIKHSGVVEEVTEGRVVVRILQTSACAACKVAGHCNASEAKEKLVDVRCADASAYKTGQSVVVSTSRDVANRALLLGFGLPFVVLVGVLFAVLRLTGDEGLAALSGLGALVPYYLLLWLLRDRIGRRVSFQIE